LPGGVKEGKGKGKGKKKRKGKEKKKRKKKRKRKGKQKGKDIYAGTECHECKAFLFVIESILDGESVHDRFRDLVGGGGKSGARTS
jgi:hypothetical protein